ncbi:HAD family hydrolase [Leptospira gomenensis]|uniref:HAD family hydrolase n=1 Tax=Leptospira gomenensis TaxID=2484974 RepID=A0A5F1Y9B0_9LEPT|nr:HAD family hydrolase [Leptospira gomenensis]TGK31706.1 HAD family hydrolase [Leptospira gomenensis]TGK41665.1 HAD family hydrolase [Leptospira gomenensis]TGK43381.1 HAD family hydrolase [Leptospira gomenensis]TGK61375.1 HAD family hydrolase [Leptospira gomenensis]
MCVFFFIFVLFVVSPFHDFARAQTTDPLLRGSWFADQEEKEAILHNKVNRFFLTVPHFTWKTDLHGRNYRFYKDGRVEFLIDRDYTEVFPDVSELDVHTSEADSLAKHGEPFSAIRLLKGIGLCYRMRFGKSLPGSATVAAQTLNRLIRHMAHKSKETEDLTDPFGCSEKDILKLESVSFRFSLETVKDWKHLFPEPSAPESGNEEDHVWKLRRFYKTLPDETDSDEWERVYRSGSEKLLRFRPDRIVFSVGMSYHPVAAVYSSKNYFQLWDLKRGINQRTMREIDFRRKKEEDSYVSRFVLVHPEGRKVPMVVLEKYFLRDNRGLLFSISGPEKRIEELKNLWSHLNRKLIVE